MDCESNSEEMKQQAEHSNSKNNSIHTIVAKEAQSTLQSQTTDTQTGNAAYHGPLHKTLTDSLSALLDEALKEWLDAPYSKSWLSYFESMPNERKKIVYFYPILLNELKHKIKRTYLQEFERVNAAQHLSLLHNQMAVTFCEPQQSDAQDATSMRLISYEVPETSMHDLESMKINQLFQQELDALDEQIAVARHKKDGLIQQIRQKEQTLVGTSGSTENVN
eukprot:CAMPEP_0202713722 /NCGR_PEP_ID=MMETSP1385-20130828/58323_1 /ASSEMBLY_ACC=CAM_ASM_000861 /TAXON_ID=933848 /ORGANISM="Elphidium margaritaceum" /LENGTH=220 /DNA_ID=CAMNT_0049374169 /DNA_START=30 /DNA_END=692 /DNA_ORIENTATION=+